MTRNRLLTVMVALTLVMQAAILYRTPARRTAPPPTTDAPQNVYFDLVDFPVKGSAQAKAVIVHRRGGRARELSECRWETNSLHDS